MAFLTFQLQLVSCLCRAKFHKLKFGTDPVVEGGKSEQEPDAAELAAALDEPITSQVSWRQGRQLLRQYLQEIGYTDTIIDVRSNRVRSLLGLEGGEPPPAQENGGSGSAEKRQTSLEQRRSQPPPKKVRLHTTKMGGRLIVN